jgi:hypothetical protein
VGDPAAELAELIRRIAASTAPANGDGGPEWVLLPAEAKRRGFSTRQFRAWCLKRGVPIREASHREAWVRPLDVSRIVEGLPLARPPASPRDEVDEAIAEARERRAKR